MVLSNNITKPPPYTVSIVLHKIFGVKASKSCRINKELVYPNILWVSL